MGITLSPWMTAFLVLMTGFAGFVDSAAGGGGLISLPAYLFAGLPPHYTYATNKFSAACGTTFATANFFKNGAMNLKVGILAAIGSFAGSALGAHIVLLLSDELLRTMMFLILPVAAVVILWQRDLPDQNRDDGTLNLKKILLALGIGLGIGLYDGIVGPGTGTFAIIAFTTLMGFDLRTANGNGKVLNLASNYASHHGVMNGRSRIGQELHAARCIELRHGLPQAHIPCLFQIVRVKVQAGLCQIHAAEKVICHLANKGLVVVDQAVQCCGIAFLCQRTKPFIRLLHGRFPALRQTARFPADRFAAVPVLPA